MSKSQIKNPSTPTLMLQWQEKLANRSLRVGVMGMGYVGLPLGLLFAEKGLRVVGVDPDERRIQALKKGNSPIRHIKNARVKAALSSGFFQTSSDQKSLRDLDEKIEKIEPKKTEKLNYRRPPMALPDIKNLNQISAQGSPFHRERRPAAERRLSRVV